MDTAADTWDESVTVGYVSREDAIPRVKVRFVVSLHKLAWSGRMGKPSSTGGFPGSNTGL